MIDLLNLWHLIKPNNSDMKFKVGGKPALNDNATINKVIIGNDIADRPLTKKSIRVLKEEPIDVAKLKRTGLTNPCPTNIDKRAEKLNKDPETKIGTQTPICIILLKAMIDFISPSLVPEKKHSKEPKTLILAKRKTAQVRSLAILKVRCSP